MLQQLFAGNPKVRGNIYHAMSHVNLEYLPPPLDGRRGRSTLKHSSKTLRDGTRPYESEQDSISD
jgi:tRNA 2-thiocytidine biosynthesis protein TtcA